MTDKDGWHIVYGKNVYVENGKVVFGTTKGENNSEVTCILMSTTKTLTVGLIFLGK